MKKVITLILSLVLLCSLFGGGALAKDYKIGFANLDDSVAFAQKVKQGIKETCEEMGIELITADNKLDGPTALQNAESFILRGVDGVIEFQTDEKFAPVLMDRFNAKNIPVIAIDIPHEGAVFFGANNYKAGLLAGEGLGKWVNENWNGKLDAIVSLELPQSGEVVMKRSQGMLDGLLDTLEEDLAEDMIFRKDCHHTQEKSKQVVDDLLTKIPKESRIGFICVQDMAALGAIAALETAGREENGIVASQNCGPEAINELVRPGTRLLGSTGYFPERYGEYIVPAMVDLIEGKEVPDEIYMDHVFVTPDNLFEYYPEAKEKYEELRK